MINIDTTQKINTHLLGHYAGIVSRLLAFVIDVVVISLVILSTTWFTAITLDILQLKPVFDFLIDRFDWVESITRVVFSPLAASLAGLVFVVSYHVFFWFFTGQTIGKRIVGLKVVSLHGKMTLWRAIIRYAAYFLSGLAFGIGFFWIIVDDRRMAWHDKVARTCVIYTWAARPDEVFLKNALKAIVSREKAIRGLGNYRDRLESLISQESYLSMSKYNDKNTHD
jgi:uncharacterized RDD family membrane protein YckC